MLKRNAYYNSNYRNIYMGAKLLQIRDGYTCFCTLIYTLHQYIRYTSILLQTLYYKFHNTYLLAFE